MPKRMLLIGLAVASLALAACGAAYNPNDLYGTPVPSSSPTPTVTPEPTASSALVLVTVSGTPIPNQAVNLYTDVDGRAGTLKTTQETNSAGETTFVNLTPTSNYCFSTTYTPAGATQQTQSICTDLWGFGVDLAF